MINFSLATSWDDSLISQLGGLNAQRKNRKIRISEIYGSLKTSLTGSGRPAYRLPDVSWKQIVEHIKCAHKHDIKFNYVMNAPDFQGKEEIRIRLTGFKKTFIRSIYLYLFNCMSSGTIYRVY